MSEKIMAENVFNCNESVRFPVYYKYDCQFEPQSAFIELDIESGEVSADYDDNIGGSVPASVWHNRVLRFPINPYMHTNDIKTLIDDHLGDFQIILDGSEVVWDGNNHVGSFDENAQRILEKFQVEESLHESIEIDFFDDLYTATDGDVWLSDGQSLSELAEEIHGGLCNGQYWSDELNSVESIEEGILNIWEELLCSGRDLPAREAQILLDDGRVEDCWLDELKEFASAE